MRLNQLDAWVQAASFFDRGSRSSEDDHAPQCRVWGGHVHGSRAHRYDRAHGCGDPSHECGDACVHADAHACAYGRAGVSVLWLHGCAHAHGYGDADVSGYACVRDHPSFPDPAPCWYTL